MESQKILLAIESSCDDTAAAVIINGKPVSNVISSQEIHARHGGVIPEMASRVHLQYIVSVVREALQQAQINKNDLGAIAVTQGPGLIGSLMVGLSFAKSLSQALNIPLITVNHMQAHVLSHFAHKPKPSFPFLNLTVSGGHTQIVLVKDFLGMELIGTTQDDAAGEAFDKSAKLLGLPYPGGPVIDKLAGSGNPDRFRFSKAKMDEYNFSFSGLKTSVLYFLQKEMKKDSDFIEKNKADLCASIQATIIDSLLEKLTLAAQNLGIQQIGIAGGVSANSEIRRKAAILAKEHQWHLYIPDFEYCTDNAAMIGVVANEKWKRGHFASLDAEPLARMEL